MERLISFLQLISSTDISIFVKYIYGMPVAVSGVIPSLKLMTLLKGLPKMGSRQEMVAMDPQSIVGKYFFYQLNRIIYK